MRTALLLALFALPSFAAPPESPPTDAPKNASGGGGGGKHEDRHDRATEPAKLSLEVNVDGKRSTWGKDVFEKAAHFTGKASDGEARDAWSLRELVKRVGPKARVTKVLSPEGEKAIDAAAWADPNKNPIVHTTRRGTLKFRWTDADGNWGEAEVKDVTGLEVSRK